MPREAKKTDRQQWNDENLRQIHQALFAAGYQSGKELRGQGNEFVEMFVGPGVVPVIAVHHYDDDMGFEVWMPVSSSVEMSETVEALTRITRKATK